MEKSSKPANDWPAGSGRDGRCVMAGAQVVAAMRRQGLDLLRGCRFLDRRSLRFAGLGFQTEARAGRWLALIGPGREAAGGG